MIKTYIAGAISGLSKKEVWEKFYAAESVVGWNCINPLRLHGIHSIEDYEKHESKTHSEYLSVDLAALRECGAIYMLPDWKNSKGAVMEHELAKELGLKITYELESAKVGIKQ